MKTSVIVWDLETVPDLGGFAVANDLAGKSDVEIREAIGDKFPKHIGALIAHWEPNQWAVDAVGAPHVGERTEKELISAFCDKIAELRPQLVTFNGNSFDLPVLRYRAMVHGVSAPGPQGKATLHEISKVMGLAGKPKGSTVARWSAISVRARSRTSRTTARPTWSAPTRCGCGMSCFAGR
jgi:predicted 3'-5' exonuclease similar to PolB exonuclease domain